jgi:hypothetical protein
VIKWVVFGAPLIAGAVFAAGCWVGWKTTMKAMDSVKKKVEDVQR